MINLIYKYTVVVYQMETFLQNLVQLVNKNNPIIIHCGNKLTGNIFDKKIQKDKIEHIMNNIKKIDTKCTIQNTQNINEYKFSNRMFKINGTNLDYIIRNVNNVYYDNRIYIEQVEWHSNQYAPPSISEYDSIEIFDELSISILNNSIKIYIKDYSTYYTSEIIIYKPVENKSLISIINDLYVK